VEPGGGRNEYGECVKYNCKPGLMCDAPPPAVRTTLDASEMAVLSALMLELRDLTQSRRTYTAASMFLRRLGAETESPRLVPADALDH
jgi:hypothetical protein